MNSFTKKCYYLFLIGTEIPCFILGPQIYKQILIFFKCSLVPKDVKYLTFQSFNLEITWWWLFQNASWTVNYINVCTLYGTCLYFLTRVLTKYMINLKILKTRNTWRKSSWCSTLEYILKYFSRFLGCTYILSVYAYNMLIQFFLLLLDHPILQMFKTLKYFWQF